MDIDRRLTTLSDRSKYTGGLHYRKVFFLTCPFVVLLSCNLLEHQRVSLYPFINNMIKFFFSGGGGGGGGEA